MGRYHARYTRGAGAQRLLEEEWFLETARQGDRPTLHDEGVDGGNYLTRRRERLG